MHPLKKPRAENPPPPRFDRKYLVAARELRDRWTERVNPGGGGGEAERLSPSRGKYDVTRPPPPEPPEGIAPQTVVEPEPLKILPAA